MPRSTANCSLTASRSRIRSTWTAPPCHTKVLVRGARGLRVAELLRQAGDRGDARAGQGRVVEHEEALGIVLQAEGAQHALDGLGPRGPTLKYHPEDPIVVHEEPLQAVERLLGDILRDACARGVDEDVVWAIGWIDLGEGPDLGRIAVKGAGYSVRGRLGKVNHVVVQERQPRHDDGCWAPVISLPDTGEDNDAYRALNLFEPVVQVDFYIKEILIFKQPILYIYNYYKTLYIIVILIYNI